MACESRRVLILGREGERQALGAALAAGPLRHWEVLEADSFERARFLLHLDECDVLLIDERVCEGDDSTGLSWLACHPRTPVLLVGAGSVPVVAAALEHGARWLPHTLALQHPELLAAALRQAARAAEDGARRRRAEETLLECRHHVSRLVNLLWEAAPADGRTGWCTQRHLMQRLHEEIARVERHGPVRRAGRGVCRARPEWHDRRHGPGPGRLGRGPDRPGQAPLRRGRPVRP
jgi:hypothetical protein